PACNGQAGSAIPQGALASYLLPGPGGFITVDWDRFKQATNYDALSDAAPFSSSAATGARSGIVEESTRAAYSEFNGASEFMDFRLRYNAGVRYVSTEQTITGPVTFNNVTTFQSLGSRYDAFLPSFNAQLGLTPSVILRLAASRTLTRPNPADMLPGTTFSDPSAQNASQGNPNLTPYKSSNFDIGGEWYTGQEGYFGVAAFHKEIT